MCEYKAHVVTREGVNLRSAKHVMRWRILQIPWISSVHFMCLTASLPLEAMAVRSAVNSENNLCSTIKRVIFNLVSFAYLSCEGNMRAQPWLQLKACIKMYKLCWELGERRMYPCGLLPHHQPGGASPNPWVKNKWNLGQILGPNGLVPATSCFINLSVKKCLSLESSNDSHVVRTNLGNRCGLRTQPTVSKVDVTHEHVAVLLSSTRKVANP